MRYVVETEKNVKYVHEFDIEADSVLAAEEKATMLMDTLVGLKAYKTETHATNIFQKEDCYV